MIEVKNLKKRFGSITAVDDISFTVVPGEILGFLGPNGAGKSTTMKIITGFLSATEGQVSIAGCDIAEDTLAAQRLIGYLPEGAPCYEEMTAQGFLRFTAEARGFAGRERDQRVDQVIAAMTLESVRSQRIETLSKGFKRRVGLAQALIHDPMVLILDEPTDGLDPNQKHHVRELIRNLSKDKMVIISTHILEEVAAVCTRAIIISEGRIVADASPDELEAQSRFHGAVTLEVMEVGQLSTIHASLSGIPGVHKVEAGEDGRTLTIFPEKADEKEDSASLMVDVSLAARDEGWKLAALYQEKGRLDEVFQRVTQGVSA